MADPAKVLHQDSLFFPQPGDIILCHRPVAYTDGTIGPLVRIYKDNFDFAAPCSKVSLRKLHSQSPEFTRGDKILRLFKVYQNWEFIPNEVHRLHLYYPGFANNWHWFTVHQKYCGDHIKNLFPKPKTHFTHMLPSKFLSKISREIFSPCPGDIVIRTIPEPKLNKEEEKCTMCTNKEAEKKSQNKLQSSGSSQNFMKVSQAPSENCISCEAKWKSIESKSSKLPWQANWEMHYWTNTLEIQKDDVLVRYGIDTKADEGTFKKTHLQVELFSYMTVEKEWKYLGMDVANFGPTVHLKDIVYHPQPGDMIISRRQKWGVQWDANLNVGGFVTFHKDPGYFGDQGMGQNLWSGENINKSSTVAPPKPQVDSWLVRLGSFDEYWDFHVNDRAEVFLLHSNGKTMDRHYTADYQHMAQSPHYDIDHDGKAHQILDVMEVEPNHWDIILRRYEKMKEDTLKNAEWARDPAFWMKDPVLWGKDIPPRYDKEVEIHTYWSGFVFEDKDLLVRPAFELGQGVLPGPDFFVPKYTEEERSGTPYAPRGLNDPPIPTRATVEIYQVRVDVDGPPQFVFFGRDKACFPTEENAKDPIFEYADEGTNLVDKLVKKRRTSAEDKEKGKGMKGGDKQQEGKDGGNKGDKSPRVIIVKTSEKDREEEAQKKRMNAQDGAKDAAKHLQLSGGEKAALS